MTAALREESATCARCNRELHKVAYELLLNATRVPHCLSCAVQFRPMLKRSLIVSLVVGTLLTAINQGNFILSGDFQTAMAWKIPLTYAVPFIVTITGGLLNARAEVGGS